jgi:quercetin dioxygenase-like cupin family protein
MAVEQAPGLWRTDLQQHDLSVPDHEVVQARVDLGPEAPFVKHTHPGEEIIYVLEGRWSMRSTVSRPGRTTRGRP